MKAKTSGFSAAPLIAGIEGRQLPEAALICNFPGGKPDDPGLMQYSDVVTFFHEFGHLMHAILGGRQRWAGVSGIATEGDFVEVPSQNAGRVFSTTPTCWPPSPATMRLASPFPSHWWSG